MTLRQLLDGERLRALIGDYLVAADRGRSADLAALFAPDGVLDIRGKGPDAGVYRGPAAILELLEANRARLSASMATPLLRHHVSSIRLSFETPGTPRGSAYFLAVTEIGPDHWGRYADTYTHVGGSWHFAQRTVLLEGWAPGSWMERARAAEQPAGARPRNEAATQPGGARPRNESATKPVGVRPRNGSATGEGQDQGSR
jgi:hypothetical protein